MKQKKVSLNSEIGYWLSPKQSKGGKNKTEHQKLNELIENITPSVGTEGGYNLPSPREGNQHPDPGNQKRSTLKHIIIKIQGQGILKAPRELLVMYKRIPIRYLYFSEETL